MAIYHCSVKIISRTSGRSSVGAAAYRAGEKIKNERDGITHDYTKKTGVIYSEILLPENAPTVFHNRAELWNAVERSEKRKDSQTAREIEVALPVEMSREEQIEIVQNYIKKNFISQGMCADFSIHSGQKKRSREEGYENPHAHIMLTTRTVMPEGFKGKDRTWNDKKLLESWREQWSVTVNQAYEKKSLPHRIDHRTLQAQGIDREATIHEGSAAHQMEERGIQSDRGNINREVQERNREYEEAQREQQRMEEEGKREQEAFTQEREKPTDSPATAKQKRGRSAEEMDEQLCLYKRQYILKKQELKKISVEVSALRRQQEKLESQARDVSERLLLMQEMEKQIRELERERKKMGIWKGREKKYLTSQIDQLTQSNQQVRHVFEAKFKVHPDHGLEAIEKLRDQAMKEVRETVEEIELQYKVEKALADIHPESRQIEEMVLQREERFAARVESVENRLVTAEAKVRLKNITVGDYEKILKRVEKEDAQKIVDLVKQRRLERRKQKTKEIEI